MVGGGIFLSGQAFLVAVLIMIGAGVAAGIFPAIKAMRLSIVEALARGAGAARALTAAVAVAQHDDACALQSPDRQPANAVYGKYATEDDAKMRRFCAFVTGASSRFRVS